MYHKTVNFSKILSPVQQLSLSYNSCHHLLGSQFCYCSCVFVHPVQELREENTALRKELADARQEPIPPSPLPLSPTFHLSSYLQMLRKLSSIPQTCKCLLKGCGYWPGFYIFPRSLSGQLLREAPSEKFTERRVHLLKSQIIQLERQVCVTPYVVTHTC